jgi:hypothetical protein
VQQLAPGPTVVELGHLDGWGRGLHGGSSIFSPWTRGNGHERFVTVVLQGKGQVEFRVASCRAGTLVLAVDVG